MLLLFQLSIWELSSQRQLRLPHSGLMPKENRRINVTELDYSHYFWQGQLVRLRPVSLEDADAKFAASLDSPSRQVLQLGVELPTTPQLLRKSLESRIDCKDDGIILFTIETLQAENVGGISLHSRDDKNGHFGFGIVIHRPYWRRGYAADAVRIAGRKTAEIEETLGYEARSAMIHRDDLVLMGKDHT